MALGNNPTPNELVKAVKALEQGGGGTATDVQVDSTSITSGGVANLKTKNGDYDTSTNKLVTENDNAQKEDKFITDISENKNLWRLSDGVYRATQVINITYKTGEGFSVAAGSLFFVSFSGIRTYYKDEKIIAWSNDDGTDGEAINNKELTDAINEIANKEDVADYGTGTRSWYVRFYSGLQICWGYENNLANNGPVTFPKPFTTARVMITQRGVSATWNDNMKVNGDETTGFTVNMGGKTNIDWIAIGLWDVNGG